MGTIITKGKVYNNFQFVNSLNKFGACMKHARSKWINELKKHESEIKEILKTQKINKELFNKYGDMNVKLLRNVMAANEGIRCVENMKLNSGALVSGQTMPNKASSLETSIRNMLFIVSKIGLDGLKEFEKMSFNVLGIGYIKQSQGGHHVAAKLKNLFLHGNQTKQEMTKYWSNFIQRMKLHELKTKSQVSAYKKNENELKNADRRNSANGGFLTPNPKPGNGGNIASPMSSDMFNFEPKSISNYFPKMNNFDNSLNVNDTTLPLKSKDVSIIFDPEVELLPTKIQSIMFGDDNLLSQSIKESMITGIFNGDKIVPVSQINNQNEGGLLNSDFNKFKNSLNSNYSQGNPFNEQSNNNNHERPQTARPQNPRNNQQNPYGNISASNPYTNVSNPYTPNNNNARFGNYNSPNQTPEDSFGEFMTQGGAGYTNNQKNETFSKQGNNIDISLISTESEITQNLKSVNIPQGEIFDEAVNSCYNNPNQVGVRAVENTPFDETIQTGVKLASFAKLDYKGGFKQSLVDFMPLSGLMVDKVEQDEEYFVEDPNVVYTPFKEFGKAEADEQLCKPPFLFCFSCV